MKIWPGTLNPHGRSRISYTDLKCTSPLHDGYLEATGLEPGARKHNAIHGASSQSPNLTTLIDTIAVASRRLINNNFNYPIPALNCNRTIASIITSLGTKYVKRMKISTDGQRSHANHCPNCTNVQLSLQHVFGCPEIQSRLFEISPEYLIFSDKAVEVAFDTASERSKASFLLHQSAHHGHATITATNSSRAPWNILNCST
ncbi:hypothetical protein TNCV_1103131 [Trichonephila clavipes]|nr:hypothetical protein TNCV_1103131 [Trichonephila clavipes]